MQAKLLAAQEACNQRVAAETELLHSQLGGLRGELESERSTISDLQDQLGRREYQLGALQEQVEPTVWGMALACVQMQRVQVEAPCSIAAKVV